MWRTNNPSLLLVSSSLLLLLRVCVYVTLLWWSIGHSLWGRRRDRMSTSHQRLATGGSQRCSCRPTPLIIVFYCRTLYRRPRYFRTWDSVHTRRQIRFYTHTHDSLLQNKDTQHLYVPVFNRNIQTGNRGTIFCTLAIYRLKQKEFFRRGVPWMMV